MANKLTHVGRAKRYARRVLDGKVAACTYITLACERFQADLRRKDLEFRDEAAIRVCAFAECFPHVKGEWASRGEDIRLEDWQCFFLVNVFGFYWADTGLRRYREVYAEVPRKNAKSTLAAVIGLYMLTADGEAGAEVFCGARKEEQALNVFRPAKQMAERCHDFLEWYGVEVMAKSITMLSSGSFFKRVVGNPGDGDSPSCWIVDEYHEHKSDNQYRTAKTGMGARQQPLLFVITTAGDDIGGPCYQRREEAVRVLQGVYSDRSADATFALLYTIDEDVDPFSVKALKMANPNYGVSVSPKFLKAEQQQAKRSAHDRGDFLTKHLNRWVNASETFLNYEDWRRCAGSMTPEDFAGWPMIIGVDLATRLDFVAAVKVFYYQDDDGAMHYVWFPEFWLPRERLFEPESPKVYQQWAEDGHINICPGDEINVAQVREAIIRDVGVYNTEEIVFDPWKAAGYEQEIEERTGMDVVRFSQTVGQYAAPMDELEAAVVSGRLHHPNHPVLNWMCSNLTARTDTNGNKKPTKGDPKRKIDGMSAGIMALGRAMVQAEGITDIPDLVVL